MELTPELKNRLLPAVIHKITGKAYIGRRGDYHHEIDERHGFKHDETYRAFYDPLRKKAHNAEDFPDLESVDLIASKVSRVRRYGTENLTEGQDLSPIGKMLYHRGVPAVKHPETGEIYTGNRGEYHQDILERHPGLGKDYGKAYKKATTDPDGSYNVRAGTEFQDKHEGFHDPVANKFYAKSEAGGIYHIPKISLSDEVQSRLVPAIQHGATGKVYTGRRGGTHEDIWHKHNLYGPENKGIHHKEGFYDIRTKQFYHRHDVGLDSTDFMTKGQLRKQGFIDSHVLAIEEASSVKTWHSATYDPRTELYTVHKSYDSYDECPKNSQWIFNTGRGREEYVVGVDPTWPDLSWYIPPGRIIFPTSESELYKYGNGRIQVRDNSIEINNFDGSYLIISADKSIRDILNGAPSYLTFRSRT
jgi:hypothetical protein